MSFMFIFSHKDIFFVHVLIYLLDFSLIKWQNSLSDYLDTLLSLLFSGHFPTYIHCKVENNQIDNIVLRKIKKCGNKSFLVWTYKRNNSQKNIKVLNRSLAAHWLPTSNFVFWKWYIPISVFLFFPKGSSVTSKKIHTTYII